MPRNKANKALIVWIDYNYILLLNDYQKQTDIGSSVSAEIFQALHYNSLMENEHHLDFHQCFICLKQLIMS